MNLHHTPVTIDLDRTQFVRLPHPEGVQVVSSRGTLWITIDGESDDIELDPGESFSFHADAPALIGVLGGGASATLRRRAPAQRGWAAWWRRDAPSLA